MKKNKHSIINPLYFFLIIILFSNPKLLKAQEPKEIKKIIIENSPENQRLLSPPIEKTNEKIKLIPPQSIRNQIVEEEKKKKEELEKIKKAEEEKKKKAEQQKIKKAEEEKKKKEKLDEIKRTEEVPIISNTSNQKKLDEINKAVEERKKELAQK